MASTDGFSEGGRTKLKAIVRRAQETLYAGLGKDPEGAVSDENIAALAKVLETSKLTPTRPDRRFPNTNQLHNCWTAFNEYQLCVDKRGKRDLVCQQRGRDYSVVCPQKWVSDWKDQTEAGISMSIGKDFVA